jgi:hypothetical protein
MLKHQQIIEALREAGKNDMAIFLAVASAHDNAILDCEDETPEYFKQMVYSLPDVSTVCEGYEGETREAIRDRINGIAIKVSGFPVI